MFQNKHYEKNPIEPPEPIKPKKPLITPPVSEQSQSQESDNKTTKNYQEEKISQKTLSPEVPHVLNKKPPKEEFEEDTTIKKDKLKRDKLKKDRLEKDEFSNKTNYLNIISEESELESRI